MLIKVKKDLSKVVVVKDGVKRSYKLSITYDVQCDGNCVFDAIATREATAFLNRQDIPVGMFVSGSKVEAEKEYAAVARKIFNKTVAQLPEYLSEFSEKEKAVILDKAFAMLSRGEVR